MNNPYVLCECILKNWSGKLQGLLYTQRCTKMDLFEWAKDCGMKGKSAISSTLSGSWVVREGQQSPPLQKRSKAGFSQDSCCLWRVPILGIFGRTWELNWQTMFPCCCILQGRQAVHLFVNCCWFPVAGRKELMVKEGRDQTYLVN